MKTHSKKKTVNPALSLRPFTFEKLGVTIAALTLLVTCFIGLEANKLSRQAAYTAQAQMPIDYTLTPVEDSDHVLHVTYKNEQYTLPAFSTEFKLQQGMMKSIYIYEFDGTHFHQNSVFTARHLSDILSSTSYSPSDVYTVITATETGEKVINNSGTLAYSYYFLLIESMAGETNLDLVCNAINLTTKEIEPAIYSRHVLLARETSGLPEQILDTYQQLLDRIYL